MIGVFKASSFFKKLGDATIGLRNSEGNVPDPGVAREEAARELGRLSKPAAAIVAVAVAEAMMDYVSLSEDGNQTKGECNERQGNDDTQ